MDLFKQKMLTLPQKSRRISLAEVIPDWPRLEKPALGVEFQLVEFWNWALWYIFQQNHNSSGSNVNRLGLPQIKVDLEELEMKQVTNIFQITSSQINNDGGAPLERETQEFQCQVKANQSCWRHSRLASTA